MRTLLSFLICLLFGVSAYSNAETCTAPAGSSSVASVTDDVYADCTASADDQFVIPAGASLAITGDFLQSGAAANSGGISVTGGTLTVDVTDDSIIVQVSDGTNQWGLNCDDDGSSTQGTIRLNGGYREFGSASPSTQTTYSANTGLPVGSVVPCPVLDATSGDYEPDCSANTTCGVSGTEDCVGYTGLWYDQARYNQPEDMTGFSGTTYNIDDGVAALDPADANGLNDVLWFPAEYGGADAASMYAITDAIADAPNAGDAYIEFDVRQTGKNSASLTAWTLADRSNWQGTLAASFEKSDPTFTVTAGSSSIAADYDYAGWCVYFLDTNFDDACADGDATRCQVFGPYRISLTADGGAGADTVTFADSAGAPFDLDISGGHDEVFFSMGCWRTGDLAQVMVPVIVRRDTNISTRSVADNTTLRDVNFKCDTDVESVVFDSTDRVQFQNGTGLGGSAVTITKWARVWSVDPASPGAFAVNLFNVTGLRGTFSDWQTTGGDPFSPTSAEDDGHWIMETAADQVINLYGLASRGYQGDALAANAPSADARTFTLRNSKFEFGYRADVGHAIDCVNAQGGPSVVEDFFCNYNAPTDIDGAGGDSFNQITDSGNGFLTLRNVVDMGNLQAIFAGGKNIHMIDNRSTSRWIQTTALVDRIVSRGGIGGLDADAFQPMQLKNFIIHRHSTDADQLLAFQPTAGTEIIRLQNGLIFDVDTTDLPSAAATGPMIRLFGTSAAEITIENVTFAWPLGTQVNFESILRISGNGSDTVTAFRNNLIFGHRPNGLAGGSYFTFENNPETLNDLSGNCLWDVENPGANAWFDAVPSDFRIDVFPILQAFERNFVGPVPGIFPDKICGMKGGVNTPGITGWTWAHRVAMISPEDANNIFLLNGTASNACPWPGCRWPNH